MRFFTTIFVAVATIITCNNCVVSGIRCCKPTYILFRHKSGLSCENFPGATSEFFTLRYGFDSTVCQTYICKDGKTRKNCSRGQCECTILNLGCKDTANECYNDDRYDKMNPNSVDEVFAKVWAKDHTGVRDFINFKKDVVVLS